MLLSQKAAWHRVFCYAWKHLSSANVGHQPGWFSLKQRKMSMLDLLRQRRSVRSYRDQALENDKLKLLCEALLRAPSSRNLQPCQFVLVDEADTLKHLATA